MCWKKILIFVVGYFSLLISLINYKKIQLKKNNKKGNKNWEYRAAPDRFTSSCLNQGF